VPPRFHPRDFMVDPSKFGEAHEAVWKRGRTIEETGRIAAAYAQHLAAIEVRRVLEEKDATGKWFAERLGQEPAQVRRKLDGDYPALPEDVLSWAIVLDTIEVIYAPGNVEQLLPPIQRGRHAGLPKQV
jgi:hypothetical protein